MSYIPEKLTYVMKPKQTINVKFDDSNIDIITEKTSIIPTFAAQNDEVLKTARDWAKRFYYHEIAGKIMEKIINNDGKIKLRIVNLEQRSEGGRAYKVIDQNGCYFDFREDILLEAILSVGIRKGGYLNGTYLWAVLGSQNRLIRNDSVLHKELIKATEVSKNKVIPIKDLEVGGIYRGKAEGDHIFIGYAVDGATNKKRMLWFESRNWSDEPIEKQMRKFSWAYKLKNSHAMRQKVGQIKIPDNIINIVQKLALKDMRDSIRKGWIYATNSYLDIHKSLILIHPVGGSPPKVKEYI